MRFVILLVFSVLIFGLGVVLGPRVVRSLGIDESVKAIEPGFFDCYTVEEPKFKLDEKDLEELDRQPAAADDTQKDP